MLKPLNKNILVEIKEQEKKSPLIMPKNPNEPFQAVIIDKGAKVDIEVEIGDTLLLVPFCGSKITSSDEKYLIITERDVIGKIV